MLNKGHVDFATDIYRRMTAETYPSSSALPPTAASSVPEGEGRPHRRKPPQDENDDLRLAAASSSPDARPGRHKGLRRTTALAAPGHTGHPHRRESRGDKARARRRCKAAHSAMNPSPQQPSRTWPPSAVPTTSNSSPKSPPNPASSARPPSTPCSDSPATTSTRPSSQSCSAPTTPPHARQRRRCPHRPTRSDAVGAFLVAASDRDASVRQAACKAARRPRRQEELPMLTGMLLASDNSADSAAIERAISAMARASSRLTASSSRPSPAPDADARSDSSASSRASAAARHSPPPAPTQQAPAK